MEHETKLESPGGGDHPPFWAVCTCGWRSCEHTEALPTEAVADWHKRFWEKHPKLPHVNGRRDAA